MDTKLPKEAEEKLREQIAKESSEKALQVGIGTAIFCFFVFFAIGGFPESIAGFISSIFATTILSFLAACFFSAIYSNRELVKHGVEIESADTLCNEPFNYVSAMESTNNTPCRYVSPFDSMPTRYNPATGFPMVGGIDAAGNHCGCSDH